jgi:hypothetical protein
MPALIVPNDPEGRRRAGQRRFRSGVRRGVVPGNECGLGEFGLPVAGLAPVAGRVDACSAGRRPGAGKRGTARWAGAAPSKNGRDQRSVKGLPGGGKLSQDHPWRPRNANPATPTTTPWMMGSPNTYGWVMQKYQRGNPSFLNAECPLSLSIGLVPYSDSRDG